MRRGLGRAPYPRRHALRLRLAARREPASGVGEAVFGFGVAPEQEFHGESFRMPLVRRRAVLSVAGAQAGDVGDADGAAFDDDQSAVRELVQNAREVFLGEVEARGDDAFAARQADGEFFFLVRVAVIVFAQQIADDALPAGMQRVGFDVGDQVVQAHRGPHPPHLLDRKLNFPARTAAG